MSKEIKGRWIIVAVFILYLLYLIIKYTPTSILICIVKIIASIIVLSAIIIVQFYMSKNRAALLHLKAKNKTEGYVRFSTDSVFYDGHFNVDDLEKQYNRYKWFYVGFYWDILVSAAKYVDKVLTIKL